MERAGPVVNGGFPLPPPGARVRVVRASHDACGSPTRVRLPSGLPASTVRRVVCQDCAQAFDADSVEELDTSPPSLHLPSLRLPELPDWVRVGHSRVWRTASVPLAAAAVIAGLVLIQDSGDQPGQFEAAKVNGPAEAGAPAGEANGSRAEGGASFVRESSFSLALPSGWQRTPAVGGATFAAAAPAGEADATLWVERDPKLAFASFETRSLEQLRALADSARVVERVAAPTPDATIVRLAANAPPGSPRYEVTLRASGPYRYYLSTTVPSKASRNVAAGARLIHGSFVPSGAKGGS